MSSSQMHLLDYIALQFNEKKERGRVDFTKATGRDEKRRKKSHLVYKSWKFVRDVVDWITMAQKKKDLKHSSVNLLSRLKNDMEENCGVTD